MKRILMTGLLALCSAALAQTPGPAQSPAPAQTPSPAQTPTPTPPPAQTATPTPAPVQPPAWAVCDAARDPKNYKEDDLWAVIINRGEGDWLFGESSYWGYGEANIAASAPYFQRFARALKDRGTELVIVQVPPRAAAEARHLGNDVPGTVYPREAGETYTRFVQMLNAAGIYAPDLLALKAAQSGEVPFFFERDHHWTPAAAALTSRQIAQHLAGRDTLKDVPVAEYVLTQKARLSTQSLGGRVAELCGVPVPVQEYQTLISTPKVEPGLLDDTTPGVVLVGTSNSFRQDEDSFAASLRHDLSRDVVNASVSGGGPWSALEGLIYSDGFRQSPPKLLVWELNVEANFKDGLSQLIPAVKGECAAPAAQVRDVLPGASALAVNLAPGDSFMVRVSDPALWTVPVKVTEAGGGVRTVNLRHQGQGAKSPLFFGELDAPATALAVDLPDTAGKVDLVVCRG